MVAEVKLFGGSVACFSTVRHWLAVVSRRARVKLPSFRPAASPSE